jgi:hypothetical protein
MIGIRVSINDIFVTYIDAPREWSWVKVRKEVYGHHKVIDKLKRLNMTTTGTSHFHHDKRYIDIKAR